MKSSALSKNKIQFIRSLELKKFRNQSNCFLAEGNKLVSELLSEFECEFLLAAPTWLATVGDVRAKELVIAKAGDIERASLLKNPQDVLAVFRRFELSIEEVSFRDGLSLLLDGIRDPGNMGTIIRLADWFGIRYIVCSKDSADLYHPKTVQATMGAIARVRVFYVDLPEFLDLQADASLPVYGTFLEGKNIYSADLTENGLIVMGNEGRGVSEAVAERVSRRLHIPSFPIGEGKKVESLNVAAATAVICSEFRRRLGGLCGPS
jgi:TrmH family RNA methyltransferase